MILALTLWAVAAVAAASSPAAAPPAVYSAFAFGARGDGKANDTAAIQRTIDAACATRGVALLPANGTFLLGGGMNALGHAYDGVTLRIEGNVTIPVSTHWSTAAQCGVASDTGKVLIPRSLCSVLVVINVDSFTVSGSGTISGFLFDEHKQPEPAGGIMFTNVTNLLVEGITIQHLPGIMFIHMSQHVMVRNITLFNRDKPEETGDIEIGGIGSHGMPPPLCAYGKSGGFNPKDPCLAPGGNWQYDLPLLRTRNVTVRDSWVSGGDDSALSTSACAAHQSVF